MLRAAEQGAEADKRGLARCSPACSLAPVFGVQGPGAKRISGVTILVTNAGCHDACTEREVGEQAPRQPSELARAKRRGATMVGSPNAAWRLTTTFVLMRRWSQY